MRTQNVNGFAHPALLLVIIVAVAAVGFAGFRVHQFNNDQKQVNSNLESTSEEKLLPADLNGIISLDKVKELASQTAEVTITDLELKNENGKLVYKVMLSDGQVNLLDAYTGEAVSGTISNDKAEDESGDEALPANFTIAITFEKAREVAQEKYPDGKVVKIHLDVEAGVVVLSVRFADKARVDVNAKNGAVVRTKAPKSEEKAIKLEQQPNRPSSDSADDNKPQHSTNSSSRSSSSGNSDSSDSSSRSSSSGNSDSSDSNSGSDSSEIRVEGTLQRSNGAYIVTANGVRYTVQFGEDLDSLDGRLVRVEGKLQFGNVIQAEKIDER